MISRSLVRELLLYCSDYYDNKIPDHIDTLCNDILIFDTGSLDPNETIEDVVRTIKNIYIFVYVFTKIFILTDCKIFECKNHYLNFVHKINNWIDCKVKFINRNIPKHDPDVDLMLDKIELMYTYLTFQFADKQYSSFPAKVIQMISSLQNYNSPSSQLTRTRYESMRKKY